MTLAFAGAAWETLGPRRHRMRPGDAGDHARLWEELAAGPGPPGRVLHLWNVTAAPLSAAGEGEPEALARGLDRSFYSLLHLAQGFGRHARVPVELLVLSNRLHAIDGGDRPQPLKAALLGVCRVLPQEQDHVRCRSVDLDDLDGGPSPRLIERCLAEMAAPAAEGTVAWRGAHRWAPSWEAVALQPAGDEARGLRERGVYVITGGLGGVGLEVAQGLAESVRARLVLVGRRAFPEREHWDEQIARQGTADGAGRTISRLRALEAAGAELLVAAADVTDAAAMEAVRRRAVARFGAVHGVFHAAGVAGGGLLQGRTPEQAAAVLAPKVQGTLVLARVFADAELLVLFSSLNAILGGIGQADYAAANAFLDSFADAWSAARSTDGRASGARRILSIDWDAWQVGMTVQADVPEELRAWRDQQLAEAIRPAEGREALARAIAAAGAAGRGGAGLAQIAVSTDPLARRLEEAAAVRLSAALAASAAAPRVQHPRPAVAPAYVAASTPLEAHLAGLWQELLGIAPIGRDDGFFELGGHSLLAGQLTSRIRDAIGVELPLQAIFSYPTPALLAAALEEIGLGESAAPAAPAAAGAALKPLPRTSRRILRSADELTDAAPDPAPDRVPDAAAEAAAGETEAPGERQPSAAAVPAGGARS